ncbi:MAG: 3-methyl-2-oxobutanoate hydroxymethyltransferase [Deltaproteobacteria bacterium]|nr:3-methyl-2-oxobutanoate hydroxymethyltransferase [Deltaproteobacteria bacterium]
MKKITAPDIIKMKQEGRKIPVLTAYSCPVAKILDACGIPMIIVGDSVGMAEAGHPTTLPVTMEEMIYHSSAVARGALNPLIVTDMPFGSYQTSITDARRNVARLVKEGGAQAVKVEGGRRTVETIKAISNMDVPVMGHIGLTPQSIHAFGGYKVQGKAKDHAEILLDDAKELENAGAFAIVLECVPAELAKRITESISIPTIGIGAGPACDGQVLVTNDMLGLDTGIRAPRFVQRYADLNGVISSAVAAYIKDVEDGEYPAKKHCY